MGPDTTETDYLVIGGGPAGSAAASVLAQAGQDVLVLEKEHFPRFHIGESLLTYAMPVLDRLGVLEEVSAAGFVVKAGAEFCRTDAEFSRVDFTEQGGGRVAQTFQVERSAFDEILLGAARRRGASVLEGAHVRRVLTEDGRVAGVTYSRGGTSHEVRARFVIDASGRSGVITSGHLRSRSRPARGSAVAVYRHFGGVDERHNPGVEGDIQVGTHDDGWVWAIPIRADVISVGVVTTPETLRAADSRQQLFDTHLARIPRVVERLRGAEPLTEVQVEGDFTYYSDDITGPGYAVAGDAGAFTNPIFSAGVYLALVTGVRAAEAAMAEHPTAMAEYADFYKTGYDTYAKLVDIFYDADRRIGRVFRGAGAAATPEFASRLFGGDFWSEDNPMTRYAREQPAEHTFTAYSTSLGCPVYPELAEPVS
ncbi:FAD-dependent oxidoreductase [Phycicoccus sp. CSK15P-2]|uniref:NAD(P)/FAD-dependent oxidoreductase n=1 Tax=Phycicoccus sp. CSK15P-2 TaxID=2807627 RepID=UPI0019503793|nr:NAD(P)/FAD-dependent oxidoreductase [Phycicoccus sp. CSK15P-2]MBM6406087.1 FAD-dependent oxidoreductase [Phycicoccus sp. CSK15P-2]